MRLIVVLLSISNILCLGGALYAGWRWVDAGVLVDNCNQVYRSQETDIGILIATMNRALVDFPETALQRATRELEGDGIHSRREDNNLVIGRAVFYVEDGRVRSVRSKN